MSAVFSDDFSADTVGVPPPPPWDIIGLGALVTASGFRGKGLRFNPTGAVERNTHSDYYDQLSIYFYFQFPGGGGYSTVMQLFNGLPDPVSGDPAPTLIYTLTFEQDGTLTAKVPGAILDNSGTSLGFALYPDRWYFAQINLKLDTVLGLLRCETQIAIDAQIVIDSMGPIVSTITTAGLSNATASVNKFQFHDATTTSIIDEIVVNAPRDAMPTYPNPGATVNARATQMVVEHAELIDSSSVRMTQGVVEHAILPDSQQVRITQMIIEVAMQAVAPVGKWTIEEA